MSEREIQIEESIKLPAWTSTCLAVRYGTTDIVRQQDAVLFNRFAFVRTSRAIYKRAFVMPSSNPNLVVLRYKTWNRKTKAFLSTEDIINRKQIKEIRYYQN